MSHLDGLLSEQLNNLPEVIANEGFAFLLPPMNDSLVGLWKYLDLDCVVWQLHCSHGRQGLERGRGVLRPHVVPGERCISRGTSAGLGDPEKQREEGDSLALPREEAGVRDEGGAEEQASSVMLLSPP